MADLGAIGISEDVTQILAIDTAMSQDISLHPIQMVRFEWFDAEGVVSEVGQATTRGNYVGTGGVSV